VFSRDGGVGQNGFEGVGRDRLDRQGVRRGFAEHGEKAIRKIPSGDRRGARNEVATEADESQKDGERQRADGCGGRDTDPDRERNRDDDVDRRTRKTPVFTGVRGLLESREDVGKIDHRSPLSLGTRRTVKTAAVIASGTALGGDTGSLSRSYATGGGHFREGDRYRP